MDGLTPADLDGTNGFCAQCKQYRRMHDFSNKRLCADCILDFFLIALRMLTNQ